MTSQADSKKKTACANIRDEQREPDEIAERQKDAKESRARRI